MILQVLIETFT